MKETNELNVGDDLEITETSQRAVGRGSWVEGTLYGHQFSALVFGDHAENPDYEIGESRISKLWIRRLADRAVVFNWDRGADIPAATREVQAMVDFLSEGLADFSYPEV